jgi:hypothetical protein
MRPLTTMLTDYGYIDINLYEYTEKINDFLNRDKINEIHRLKKLNQLGLISEIYESTHHSKWEYIIIQMYLSQLISNEKGYGLKSNIKLKSDKYITVIDLINSWTFLFNIGHLQRTFSSERYWFEAILNNTHLQKHLSKKLPRKIFKMAFTEIIENQDYFRFFYIISILFIHQKLSKKSKEISDEMLDIFELWFRKDPRKSVKNAKDLFRKIRKFSFIYLDTNNSHTCFNIQTTLFFNHIKDNANTILTEDENELIVVFDEIEKILQNNVYSSIEVKQCLMCYLMKRKEQLKRKTTLKSKEISKGITYPDKFMNNLLSARTDDIYLRWSKDDWKFVSRFDFRDTYFLNRDRCKYFAEESYMNTLNHIHFLIEPIKSDNLESTIIDVFCNDDLIEKDIGIIATKIKNYILKYYNINDEFFIFSAEKIVKDLFQFCLKSFFDNRKKIRYSQESPCDYSNFHFIDSFSKTKSIVSEIRKDTNKSGLSKERKHEIFSLLKLIKDIHLSGATIIALQSVRILDENSNDIAEFDGVAINISRNKIKAIFIEAKSGGVTSTKALNELVVKLDKLNLVKYKIPRRTRRRKKDKYAYSILEL